jgi:uncharacterized protein DUF6644
VTASLVATWAHLYNDNRTMSDAVTFVHLAGIMLGGGVAIAADRAALHHAMDSDVPYVAPLGGTAVHRWVIIALAAITASGVLMLFADLHTYVTSPLFWVKMGLTLLLVGNGYVRLRAERAVLGGIQSARTRFRSTSLVSLVLWLAVLLAGTMMVSAD